MAHQAQKIKRFVSARAGFTLIELLLVVAIISLLTSIVVASLDTSRKKARDVRRIADMRTIQNALELYYADNKFYPVHTADAGCSSSWDCSHIGTFMSALVGAGLLPQSPVDPINNTSYFYRYARTIPVPGNPCNPRTVYYLTINQFEVTPSPFRNPSFCVSGGAPGGAWVSGAFN